MRVVLELGRGVPRIRRCVYRRHQLGLALLVPLRARKIHFNATSQLFKLELSKALLWTLISLLSLHQPLSSRLTRPTKLATPQEHCSRRPTPPSLLLQGPLFRPKGRQSHLAVGVLVLLQDKGLVNLVDGLVTPAQSLPKVKA